MNEIARITEQISLLAFLVCSMSAVGLALTPRAMVAPLCHARLVITAMLLNFALGPAFAWLLTRVFPLEQPYAVGLLLLGGAAGAPFLPKLVEMARGDAAVAVALMVLLTLGTIFFMPFALPLMIPGFQTAPWDIARSLLLLMLLPFFCGMIFRGCAASTAEQLAPILAKIGSVSLMVVSAVMIIRNFPALIGIVGHGAIALTVVYIAGLFAAGRWCEKAGLGGHGVLGFATAARNFGAALVPATQSFSDPKVATMLVVSATVTLALTFALAARQRRAVAPGLPPGVS
ncbi:MAG TPA: bile acid:sodium symporter [Verrucomicrobiaceae bacterium]|jgi:BASS family bile acid:Na+ symporter